MPQRPQRRARPMDLVSPSTSETAVLHELLSRSAPAQALTVALCTPSVPAQLRYEDPDHGIPRYALPLYLAARRRQ